MADIDTDDARAEARQGGWPQRDRKIAALQRCMSTALILEGDLMRAEQEMEVGNTFDDERNGLADIMSNLTGRIKELEQ